MAYSEEILTAIIQAHRLVFSEIQARDVVFRCEFDGQKRAHVLPWSSLGRSDLQEEEFELWIKLHAAAISNSQAIESMTDLMEQYYGQTYPLRNMSEANADFGEDTGTALTEIEFTTFGELIHHPEVFLLYPSLTKLAVKLVAGRCLANGDLTSYRTDTAGREWIEVARDASHDALRMALLREMQLAINRMETC